MTRGTEVRLDDLLGRKVLARNGRPIGRLEEFRTKAHAGAVVIDAYVIGAGGLLERLGVAAKRLFGLPTGGFLARWDQVDLSDPRRPRLTCDVEDLGRL